METNKFFTIILTMSLVIFASGSGISNTVNTFSGDNLKSGSNSSVLNSNTETPASTLASFTEAEYSYLRFDVNDYITDDMVEEIPAHATFDYLRFDVNNYLDNETPESMELPSANEFDYLRFDVNTYVDSNADTMYELPANEFDYLRFDVSTFCTDDNSSLGELPVQE